MPGPTSRPFVLGIDLGSASLGWALITRSSDDEPAELLRSGARIFDPGVAAESIETIQRGKDEPKAAKRRQMRLQRRQLRRRAGRQRDLFELLQQHGLLPSYASPIVPGTPHGTNAQRSAARHEVLTRLDRTLHQKWLPQLNSGHRVIAAADHVLPYFLRAHALDAPLDPHELGRALYHLGQRRGFLSNRKQAARTEEEKKETSKVKEGISQLAKAIAESGARTLGEYFSRLDPAAARIRVRSTARSMFMHEFESIWQAQAAHHPAILTSQLKAEVHKLLFFQRPTAKNEHLVGECELEPGRKRAPLYRLEAQRFRLLQRVNDLRVRQPDFTERKLTAAEREKLLHALETEGDLTFGKVRDLLGHPRQKGLYNLERGGEKTLRGNRTNALMLRAFGQRWDSFSKEKKTEIVVKWADTENDEDLIAFAKECWLLNDEQAKLLAEKPSRNLNTWRSHSRPSADFPK